MTGEEAALFDDAIQSDAYLDRLLGASVPTAIDDLPPGLEPIADAAANLRSYLVRFHPSFRFEERLAARLRAAAQGHAPGDLIEFPGTVGDVEQVERRLRGRLVGGAIASGVSIASLAGAAVVAWRRFRSDRRWERLA
jgi:hypothetical protein